ncbi:MAG: hypothetical protein ABSE73_08840 [Planctomycetota bacterium]
MPRLSHTAMALLLLAATAGAGEVRLDASYLVAGEKTKGMALMDLAPSLPKEMLLRVTLVREVDVPDDATKQGGVSTATLLERPAGEQAGPVELPFEAAAEGMLCGKLHVKAELFPGKDSAPLSVAWSAPVLVGVRHRLDLAGEWAVEKVEPFVFEDKWRPKEWKLPENVKTLALPGTFDPALTQWFRGWVTVKREVKWQGAGGTPAPQPRFLRVSGVWDSVLATVDGAKVGEVTPVEDLDCLTHWVEFHSQFKGEQNRPKRLMMSDHDEYPALAWPLPKPLAAEGRATVELRLRGTSGLFRPKPSYGIHGDLHLELAPAVCIQAVSFDTEKPGEMRRFKFKLALANDTGKEFRGTLRAVYGQYAGTRSYTGPCPAYATAEQPLVVPAGGAAIEVLRDEPPRFATCRATFLIVSDNGKVWDGVAQEFHTVAVEIRDKREIWLNNERFIIKGRGSASDDPNKRWQLRVNGVNVIRGPNQPAHIEDLLAGGLLTSAGGALLASCERCTFWNPKDTSNITRTVAGFVRTLGPLPGIIEWEATNELFGEPEECRVAIAEAFHKLDPYHRPVLATKGSGEWEAESKDGRVAGLDIVGVQYLLSKEAVESVTASITEQPLICSEVNWNDGAFAQQNMWQFWLERGLSGALLFDYSGGSTDQGVPLTPPPDNEPSWWMIRQFNRDMYQDLVANAVLREDGRVTVTVGNRMPYTLNKVALTVRNFGRFDLAALKPGDAADLLLPRQASPPANEFVALRADYCTHGGLPHTALLTPRVAKPAPEGGHK